MTSGTAAPAKDEDDERSWGDLTESEDDLYKSDSSSDSVEAPSSPLVTETGDAPSWVGAFGDGQPWSSTSSSSQPAEADGESTDSNDSSETVQPACTLDACKACSSKQADEKDVKSDSATTQGASSSSQTCTDEPTTSDKYADSSHDSTQDTPHMHRHEAFDSSLSELSSSEAPESVKEQDVSTEQKNDSTDTLEPDHKRRKIIDWFVVICLYILRYVLVGYWSCVNMWELSLLLSNWICLIRGLIRWSLGDVAVILN